jgi:hypothetical protein
MKSGRGRLSSTNSLTEKTLRNSPCEYAAWSPSCQSPTCQSPAAIRPYPDFESIAWYAAMSEICSQSRSWLHFNVENIDGSRLIGPACRQTTTTVRDATRRIPSSRPERPIASCATISVIISRIPDGDKHRFVNYDLPSPNLTSRASTPSRSGERNWVKDRFEMLKRHPRPTITRTLFLIAAARPSWVNVSGPAIINSFVRGSESVARSQDLVRIPIVREITEPTGEGQSTLFALS